MSITLDFAELPGQKNTPAFVIGNGISRRGIDLNLLRNRGIVFGCNFLLRDYLFEGTPFFLFAQDHVPMIEITRRKFFEKGNLVVPKAVLNHPMMTQVERYLILQITAGSTGHNALRCAVDLLCDPIVLIGMGDRFKKVEDSYTDNVYNHGDSKINSIDYRVYKDHIQRQCQEHNTHRAWPQGFVKIIESTDALVVSTNPDNIMGLPAISMDDVLELFPPTWGCKSTPVGNSSWLLPCPLDTLPKGHGEVREGKATGR